MKRKGEWTTLLQPNSGIKEVGGHPINQNGVRGVADAHHDPANPMSMKSKVCQGPLEEPPAYLVIGLLHVQLDSYQTMMDGGTSKVMHELLINEDII